jgi:hypothetical protein
MHRRVPQKELPGPTKAFAPQITSLMRSNFSQTVLQLLILSYFSEDSNYIAIKGKEYPYSEATWCTSS